MKRIVKGISKILLSALFAFFLISTFNSNKLEAANNCSGKFGIRNDGSLKCTISTKSECPRDCKLGFL